MPQPQWRFSMQSSKFLASKSLKKLVLQDPVKDPTYDKTVVTGERSSPTARSSTRECVREVSSGHRKVALKHAPRKPRITQKPGQKEIAETKTICKKGLPNVWFSGSVWQNPETSESWMQPEVSRISGLGLFESPGQQIQLWMLPLALCAVYLDLPWLVC